MRSGRVLWPRAMHCREAACDGAGVLGKDTRPAAAPGCPDSASRATRRTKPFIPVEHATAPMIHERAGIAPAASAITAKGAWNLIMDTLKLTYFDFPGGRAEPARLALHIGGIAFEDHRFAPAEFAQVCKHTPLHQVPVLHVNGLQVTQSDAITRYAGRLAGLYPEDPFQALLCDEVMGALEDLNIKVGATFGLGADELRSARGALVADALPRYLRWLDAQLEGRGGEYFADGRLTIADLKAFVVARWLCSGKLDHIPTGLVASVAPGLEAHMQRIGSIPAITHYYAGLGLA